MSWIGTNQWSGISLHERFWQKVNRRSEEECWPWNASCRPDGYGQFLLNGKYRGAHVAAFILTVGREPDGLVLHTCDRPVCCNPLHLYEGDYKQNAADKVARNGSWKASVSKGKTGVRLSRQHRTAIGNGQRGKKHPEGCRHCIAVRKPWGAKRRAAQLPHHAYERTVEALNAVQRV